MEGRWHDEQERLRPSTTGQIKCLFVSCQKSRSIVPSPSPTHPFLSSSPFFPPFPSPPPPPPLPYPRRRRRRLFVVPRLSPNRTWHDFQPRILHREPLVIKASDDRVNKRARRRAQSVQRRIRRRLRSLSRGREIISFHEYCAVLRSDTVYERNEEAFEITALIESRGIFIRSENLIEPWIESHSWELIGNFVSRLLAVLENGIMSDWSLE